MKIIKEIVWEDLPEIQDYKNEEYYKNDETFVNFKFNNEQLKADLSITLNLETKEEKDERGFVVFTDVVVTDVELFVKDIYDFDGGDFATTAKEFADITNELKRNLTNLY